MPCFVNYKKGCTRLAAASDKVYQLLPHGRWFSPGNPTSSTTKTGRHDIAEILLKVALNTKNLIWIFIWFSIFIFIVRARVAQWVRWLDYLSTHTSLSPIQCEFVPCFVNYKKGCTWLAATSDKVYQLFAHGWRFSLGTLTSSTSKTGRHDIAESGVTPKINQSICFNYN